MFTMNSFACYRHLASTSREKDIELKIPCSITCISTHAHAVTPTDEDHVCQTWEGPPGAKTMIYIWRSWGRDCNAATMYHHVTSSSGVRHDYQASLGSEIRLAIRSWSLGCFNSYYTTSVNAVGMAIKFVKFPKHTTEPLYALLGC